MKNTNTLKKLLKIDVNDKALHKTVDTIHAGMEAKTHISNFKKASYFKSIG